MSLISQLEDVQQKVQQTFSSLSSAQLNWKPEPSKWSIAQCLDHLLVSNASYFPIFDDVLKGRYQLPFLQKLNPLKKVFGPLMIKSLGPQSTRKLKNPGIFNPAASALPVTLVADFSQHQQRLKNYFTQLQPLNTTNTVIASPVTSFITYTLADALQVITVHEQRHLNQALNVLNHPNFPNEL